jgi:pimeloyl-ACP methyl ester carboxylesterase
VAEAEFERDIRSGLRKMYYGASGDGVGWTTREKKHGEPLLEGMPDPDPFPPWLSDADIDYYVSEFKKSGFRGPLNRYRNFERDWEYMNSIEDRIIRQPSLFIAGERDLVLKMFGGDPIARMRENTADLRGVHLVANVGHWVQQEAPGETTGHLIDWLATL